MKPRIIVCGLGRTGLKIFQLLQQQEAAVVGISDRPLFTPAPESLIIGELRSAQTLIAAGLKTAQALVLANDDDALNLAIVTQARLINPHIRIINRLFNATLGERLDYTLPDHVSMSVSALAAPIFAFAALGNQAIGQLKLYKQTWPIQEIIITENHPWLGLPISELWDNPSRMLIYYLSSREEIDLVSAVRAGRHLERGDHVIVGIQPTVKVKRRYQMHKFFKAITNLRQYQRYVRPVTLVALTLVLMICLATLTYVSVNYKIALVDSLYFSVGMITGAGGKEEVVESAPDSIKIFTAVMMIVGAGVIGICYALLNDFILGTRFKQFWDAARVPGRQHYIVCGLGAVGMEIVRQLHSQGHEVVIIENDTNNRFLHTARSLGVPIILEDARLNTTLQAANIHTAAGMLVVTSEDMVNVEIALTAKAIAPQLILIVRGQDEQISQSIQEVFEFDAVLCPRDLATHSFVAAALGGKILGNGMTNDLLWVAVATLITPNHPFRGQRVEEVSRQADLVPLYLERNSGTIHSWELLKVELTLGDILYLTIPATKLQQLWRVSSSPKIHRP
jgi:voltage-gated potassium channel Kch